MGVGDCHANGRFIPGKETRYTLYGKLGGFQGRSGQVPKTSPPPGFDPRAVQPVASRFTDRAIPVMVYSSSSVYEQSDCEFSVIRDAKINGCCYLVADFHLY
jgi:hypothetical protein